MTRQSCLCDCVCPQPSAFEPVDRFSLNLVRYGIGGHTNIVLLNLLQSAITHGGHANLCGGSDTSATDHGTFLVFV